MQSYLKQFIENYWPARKSPERDSLARKLEYHRMRADKKISTWAEFEAYEIRRDREDQERENPG